MMSTYTNHRGNSMDSSGYGYFYYGIFYAKRITTRRLQNKFGNYKHSY